jgi:T4-like virus tail tube protein gp19
MALSDRSSVAKRFALMLDSPGGQELGAIVSMVDGGGIKGDVIEQRIGADRRITKVIGNSGYDPISAQIGMAVSGPVIDWIRKSLQRKCYRIGGSVMQLDMDGKTTHAMNFRDALLTELTIPAADPKSNETQSITVKFQPEFCEHITTDGEQIRQRVTSRQKHFSSRHFRFEIDKFGSIPTTKVEALTVKQTVTPFRVGAENLPYFEPSNVQIPNITFMVPLQLADQLFAWHKEFVVEGKNGNSNETTASLTFLSQNMKEELVRVTFDGVGMISMSINKSQNIGQADSQQAKVELYAEAMDITFPGAT